MNRFILSALVTLASLPMAARAQNLIRNGEFEQPVIATNSYTPGTPTDWAYDGPEQLLFNGNGGDAAVWPYPQYGQQYAYIGNAAGSTALRQTFSLTNTASLDFLLSWDDSSGHVASVSGSPYRVELFRNTGGDTLVFSADYDAYHQNLGTWQQRSTQFGLPTGTYTLYFKPNGSVGGLGTLIDNVSVTPVPGADVQANIRASAVDICFPGRAGVNYQVQYTTSLVNPSWTDIGSVIPGAGDNYNCATDGIVGTTARYYRVVRVP